MIGNIKVMFSRWLPLLLIWYMQIEPVDGQILEFREHAGQTLDYSKMYFPRQKFQPTCQSLAINPLNNKKLNSKTPKITLTFHIFI